MPGQDKFWGVRDMSERTIKLIKVYAIEHDMSIARAIEAMVDAVHRRHDSQLTDALLQMYQRLQANDIEGAKQEAEVVRELLAERR
jgi:hypothetical protein